MKLGRVSKRWLQEQEQKRRRESIGEMDSVFAEHERRVKAFLSTAGQQTEAGNQQRQADSLNIQESDELLFRVAHSLGRRKKNLAQMDGDEPYE
jgi:hypothetical protein